MMRPTFLGIGAMRAGTTLLHTLLRDHPQVFMPDDGKNDWGKELHFFNSSIQWESLAEYEAHFAGYNPDCHRACGEITPAYSILPLNMVHFVSQYLGQGTKIILVVRDPVERILSHLRLRDQRSGNAKSSAVSYGEMVRFSNAPACRRRTQYTRIYKAWSSAFPGNVLIVSYDDLVGATRSTLRDVFQHIGVDPQVAQTLPDEAERVYASNPGQPVQTTVRDYLARRWAVEGRFFRETIRYVPTQTPCSKYVQRQKLTDRIAELLALPLNIPAEFRFRVQMMRRTRRLRELLCQERLTRSITESMRPAARKS